MLTPLEKRRQSNELRENYKRLNQELVTTLNDLQMIEKGILVYPFTKMVNHSANKWFTYDTSWRNK